MAALRAAGEQGPFILAGHSFGGLLAANIARRAPEQVATLVLLDPTPLETIVFGPRLGALGQMRHDALLTGLLRLVGLNIDLGARRIRRNPAYAEGSRAFEAELGSALTTLRAVEIGAGSALATWSIYRELSPQGAAARGWETVVYDRDLDALPVMLVAPGNLEELASLPEIAGTSAGEARRMALFFATTRERYLAISSQARRVITPPGTTHQFPYEAPQFVIDLVLAEVRTHAR
jgi:pimeloyl-ACP methyl ester carboxylesterase